MISNQQRREVAARLRNFERLRGVFRESNVCAFCDVLGVGYMDWEHICARLADLIDRPLAHIGTNKHGRGFCTNCGCDDWCIADGSHFCPDCGVELLDD